jgi:Planctomycete cytochrome C
MVATLRAVGIAVIYAGLGLPALAQERVQYNRDIRPILSNTCFKCHGPAARKGGVRLDLRDEAIKAARSGAIPIRGGKPDESEVVRRIFAEADDERMPPPSAHVVLKSAQKELIKRWIAEGAPYQRHWFPCR